LYAVALGGRKDKIVEKGFKITAKKLATMDYPERDKRYANRKKRSGKQTRLNQYDRE
jgi:nucleoside diphosphate kinase